MGMYTDVEPHPDYLPDEYKHLIGWQTGDVVEPVMGTLVINENGKLLYRLGFQFSGEEHRTFYTGTMVFYTWRKHNSTSSGLVYLSAKFFNGYLINIKEVT